MARPTSWPAPPTCTNATDDRVGALRGYPQNELGRLFTGRDRGDFHDFLRSRLSPASASIHADRLLRSSVAPSKQLLAVAAEELRTREQFVLLVEQRVASTWCCTRSRRHGRATTSPSSSSPAAPAAGRALSRCPCSASSAVAVSAAPTRPGRGRSPRPGGRSRRCSGTSTSSWTWTRTASTSSSPTRRTACARHRRTGGRRPSCVPTSARSTSSSTPPECRCSCSIRTRSSARRDGHRPGHREARP
jgi:hypothetical protein